MGVSGMMRTGIAGMNAQSNRLSAVADNVANSSTIGYKKADAQFSTLVVSSTRGAYQSGGINTNVRYDIKGQGIPRTTMRETDVMIGGGGFFRVQDSSGAEYLTRSGSFQRDRDGYIVNSGGFYLLDEHGDRIQAKGGATGMIPPEVTKKIDMALNLKANESLISAPFDKDNPATYHQKKSVKVYDPQGAEITLNIYATKTAAGKWRMDLTQVNDADQEIAVGALDLAFNGSGELTSPTGLSNVNIVSSAGEPFPVDLDFGGGAGSKKQMVTQLGSEYSFQVQADGIKSGYFDSFALSKNGEVMVTYSNGVSRAEAIVGMTTVASPNMLSVLSGTVFQTNNETGSQVYGRAGEGVFGSLMPGAVEESNADMGDELTNMIEAQRNYTANSKVFQTGSELMDIIVNLKR